MAQQYMTMVPDLRKKFLDKHYSSDKNYYDSRDISRVKSDDLFVLQFLNGREGNVSKALKVMIEAMKWRNSFGINDLTEDDINKEVLNSGILVTHGHDKKGATLLISMLSTYTWKGNKEKTESYRKLFALSLEKHQREHPEKKITTVTECAGSTLANTDMDNSKFVTNMLTNCYPDILENAYLLHFPGIFQALWKILKPMLGYIAKKYIFLKEGEVFNYIDKDQLPVSYGGESTFECPGDKKKST